jgi:hypothetical protein
LEEVGAVFDTPQDIEHRIRVRAYLLWEREGRPEDRADEHWRRAAELERARDARERRIDAEGEDSFPASDPPSHNGIIGPRLATA